jgi:hypothetical protein
MMLCGHWNVNMPSPGWPAFQTGRSGCPCVYISADQSGSTCCEGLQTGLSACVPGLLIVTSRSVFASNWPAETSIDDAVRELKRRYTSSELTNHSERSIRVPVCLDIYRPKRSSCCEGLQARLSACIPRLSARSPRLRFDGNSGEWSEVTMLCITVPAHRAHRMALTNPIRLSVCFQQPTYGLLFVGSNGLHGSRRHPGVSMSRLRPQKLPIPHTCHRARSVHI